ncbi:MAG TPA: histidine kinase [Thermoanaerobaculia bacterium]|nr:histidine kinase [Thermoanaerobaculia bacterium]
MRSSAPAVFLGWLVVGIFRYAHHVTYNFPLPVSPLPVVVYYSFDALRWTAFTLFVLWFVHRYPAEAMKRATLWTVIAPLLLLSATVMLLTDLSVFSSPTAAPLGVPRDNIWSTLLQKRFHRMLLDVTTVVIIAYGINIQKTLAAEELRAARLEAAVTETRLTALRQQLHPHLLFNTLNSIVALIRRQPERAERMMVQLSDLLRAILRVGNRSTIPLREDVAFAEAFLRIQQYRFPNGLHAEIEVPEALLDAAVPPLLLQPLVENSVKHGIDGTGGPAVISIVAASRGADLVLQVSDPGPVRVEGAQHEGFGVGLGQIRERLRRMYGTAASIDLSSSPGHGTTVTLRLPLALLEPPAGEGEG